MKKLKKTTIKRTSKKPPIIFNSPSKLPFDNFLLQNAVTECDPDFIVRSCACGRSIILKGCMRKDCIRCTKRLNVRRTASTFSRFKEMKRMYDKTQTPFIFCYTDFTIPPHLRQDYADPKRWQFLRSQLWLMLKRHYGAVFAVEGTHPIGDQNPTIFHPHLNYLWVIDKKHKPYLDLDELRGFFQVFLGYTGPVNLHHDYGQSFAQLMHWCKYITRIFPAFAVWTGHLRWYGDYPLALTETECICATCLQRFSALGFIAGSDVRDFEERGFFLGRAPPWENDKKITFFKKINID